MTMNDRFDVLDGDVSIVDGRIAAIGSNITDRHDRVIDARGGYVLPGLIQTHIHLCQTLFRGFADDLPLMDWLRRRVWPMEAAHTPATLRASAQLAATELLCSGTTAVLTMETVHDTDVVFEAVAESGLRATIGKCMMDFRRAGAGAPAGRYAALARREPRDSERDGTARPAAGCTPRSPRASRCRARRALLETVAGFSDEHQALVHTHAAESHDEIAIVRQISGGLTNLAYLASFRLASPRLCAAHCVWVDEPDQQLLADCDVKVMHCPGSNLKLGSGVAPSSRCSRGTLPCRSAPTARRATTGWTCSRKCGSRRSCRRCERRRARSRRARCCGWPLAPARARLAAKTRLARWKIGKRADVIVVDRDRPHLAPGPDPYSTLVYAARGSDVRATIVDGEVLVDDFAPVRVDRAEVVASARSAAQALAQRAGIR